MLWRMFGCDFVSSYVTMREIRGGTRWLGQVPFLFFKWLVRWSYIL